MKKLLIIIILLTAISTNIRPQENKAKVDNKKSILQAEGFGELKWGAKISTAKDKVIGKIVYFDESKSIITKDGDIEYKYGFFFIDPAITQTEEAMSNKAESNEEKKKLEEMSSDISEARLYYVSTQFPYLLMQDVKRKIEKKYGPPTGEDIKDNRGAIIWESEITTIIMWIDKYENNPYCKKINYISKEIAVEINKYQKLIFNKKEIEILKNLSV